MVWNAGNLRAQNPDLFSNAHEFVLPDKGYGATNQTSPTFSLSKASVSQGEYFPDELVRSALVEKSLWFKFSIPTQRTVSIQLLVDDSTISQNDVGFAVYRNPVSFAGPHHLSDEVPVMNQLGSAGNNCLSNGIYYIQVVSRSHVDAGIQIALGVSLNKNNHSTTTNLGALDAGWAKKVSFQYHSTPCDHVESEQVAELCPYPDYDALMNWNVRVDYPNAFTRLQFGFSSNAPVFIRIAKEDLAKPMDQWQVVDTMSFIASSQIGLTLTWDCVRGNSLTPGRYRIFVFRAEQSFKRINFTLYHHEHGSPLEYDVQKLPSNQRLGSFNNNFREFSGELSCNTPVLYNVCPTLNTDLFELEPNGDTSFLDKQTWYTFELKEDCRFSIENRAIGAEYAAIFKALRFRVYQGDDASNCQLFEVKPSFGLVYCLPAGRYTLRLLVDSKKDVLDYEYRIGLRTEPLEARTYKFNDSTKAEQIGDFQKLFPGNVISEPDYFDNGEQTIVVEGVSYRGSLQFRELFIQDPELPFTMGAYSTGGGLSNFHEKTWIFKGRISQGQRGEYLGEMGVVREFDCGFGESGWITLVSMAKVQPGDCHRVKRQNNYAVILRPLVLCPTGSQETKINQPYQVVMDFNYSQGEPIPNVVNVPGGFCFNCQSGDSA
ncbi:MAG: hypothetical protein LPK45_11915, partial [Bacteroidota bacterium]|nr:hypothetical protein [Bacteroidota bacterium]MDX5431816.1 hypothetical protein [Bacteroidota bacterium]MDX5470529.1 hypothetical protein [Bacteroidota bacterium]